MNKKILYLTLVFSSFADAWNGYSHFCNTATVDTFFPVKNVHNLKNVFIPTNSDMLNQLHDVYEAAGKTDDAAIEIWCGVERLIFCNALDAIMFNDRNRIIDNVQTLAKFAYITKNAKYNDEFLDRVLPEKKYSAASSIAYPIRVLSNVITNPLRLAKFGFTPEEVRNNGGGLAMKLYDTVLKNYEFYDSLFDYYNSRISSPQPIMDFSDTIKSLFEIINKK